MYKKVIGLMSGTSMDGIDAAFLKTDGFSYFEAGETITVPYTNDLRGKLSEVVFSGVVSKTIEELITVSHADAINQLLVKTNSTSNEIDLIGFHGHTVFHNPAKKKTLQIGDGNLLAKLTGIDVVCDFRSNDLKHGGQGAPLVPLFHQALTSRLKKPLAILNLGGVANVTWLGHQDKLIAFDTGPGNALLDDFMNFRLGKKQDTGGKLALTGNVDQGSLSKLLSHSYFLEKAPKSLDRNEFDLTPISKLSTDKNYEHYWDYLYEPDAKEVLESLFTRYIESLVYRAIVENLACEQASRMVAMKSASDNAADLIDELQLIYNKDRQAAITQEISEIISGAAAL